MLLTVRNNFLPPIPTLPTIPDSWKIIPCVPLQDVWYCAVNYIVSTAQIIAIFRAYLYARKINKVPDSTDCTEGMFCLHEAGSGKALYKNIID